MIVDTSALIAVLLDGADSDRFRNALEEASMVRVSGVSYWEASVVMTSRKGVEGRRALEKALSDAEAVIEAATEPTARVASDAWLLYGKRRHPAGLNFGDCFAYAPAKSANEPRSSKGDDFTQTDIEGAP